jgi:hypothetical protein
MGFSSELAVLLTAEPEDEWLDNYEPPSDGTCGGCGELACICIYQPSKLDLSGWDEPEAAYAHG